MPTGRPLTLRCAKCKRGENWNPRPSPSSADNLFRTGRERVAKTLRGRHNVLLREVFHSKCNWVGWTDHSGARALPIGQPSHVNERPRR